MSAVPEQLMIDIPEPKLEAETETVYESVTREVVYPSDVSTEEQMHIVESSGSLSFWDDSEEDVYHVSDGDPA